MMDAKQRRCSRNALNASIMHSMHVSQQLGASAGGRARLEFNRNYYIHKCPEQRKKYVECRGSLLLRTGPPVRVSPAEDCLLSGHLPRHRVLPRQSHDVLEEGRGGASRGRGPWRDPPQPQRILPAERQAETHFSRPQRPEQARLCGSSLCCEGRHRHQTRQSSDQDQSGVTSRPDQM